VSWITRISGRRRARLAARALGSDPSAENYVSLAQTHVAAGDPQAVLRVCTEGLEQHHGDATLTRLAERARSLLHDHRIRVLQGDLQVAPRPALWRELCELLLEVGKVQKAEEAAETWWRTTQDGEALLYRARCRAEMFFTDRRATDGRVAHELACQAHKEVPSDPRPLRLAFEVARRCGAWQEARSALARLLELMPGNPDLEQRFRAVQANLSGARTLERALLEVERSGEFQGDVPEVCQEGDDITARPLLQTLGARKNVLGAVYLRGSTALVQGPHGPTADRTARSVREVLQASRGMARRLGLGQPQAIELEGSFGTLHVLPGERGTGALWTADRPSRGELETLARLAGAAVGGAG
jgi:hypothetical protein